MSRVVKNTTIYLMANIMSQGINFILLPLYTEYLTPREYGIVNAMITIQMIFTIVMTLSLDRSYIRLYWDYNTEKDRKMFLSSITSVMMIFSLFFFIVILAFNRQVSLVFPDIPFYPYYFFTIVTVVALNFSLPAKNYYRIKENAKKYFYISFVELLFNSSLTVYFIVFLKNGAEGMIMAKMIASFLMLPIYLLIIKEFFVLKMNFKMIKEGLNFCLPSIPGLVAAWILGQSDRIFIANYMSLSEVGIFSLSRRIGSIISTVSSSFAMSYYPVFFLKATTNSDDDRVFLYKFNNYFVLLLIYFSFIIVLFTKDIVIFFLNQKYHSSYLYIPLVCLSLLISSISSTIIGAYFQQSKKMKQDMLFGILGSIIALILNFLLIKPFGLQGAVIASVFSALIIIIIGYFYAKKKCYFIKFDWVSIFFFSMICIFIVILLNYIFDFNTYLMIFLKIICAIIVYIFFINKLGYRINLRNILSQNDI